MEKKNIMFMALVLVAVLLIAVVGASFAYFNVLGSATSTTTSLTGLTPNVGTVGTTGGVTLYLKPTAAQMASGATGNKYAVAGTSGDAKTAAQNHVIATIKVTGGDTTTKYTCNGNIKITLPDNVSTTNDNTIKTALTAGNLFIKFTKGSSAVTTLKDTEIDLFTAVESGLTENYTVTLTGANAQAQIKADVYLKNTTGSQNALINKTIKVNVVATTTSCTMA